MTCSVAILQALAELYHIQPPLVLEDESASDSPAAANAVDKEQTPVTSTPSNQLAANVTAGNVATTASHSNFISREALGICSSADTPMTDSVPLDDAIAATADGANQQGTPASSAGVTNAENQPPSRWQQKAKPFSKLLCSQEWKVQHVSTSLTLADCLLRCTL